MKPSVLNEIVKNVTGITISHDSFHLGQPGNLSEDAELDERWLEKENPSVELNDAIDDINGFMFQLQMEYIKNSKDRNLVMDVANELLRKVKDRAEIALNRLSKSGPEDANEAEDLGEAEPNTDTDVIRNPKMVNVKMPKNSFVQAGPKRLGLDNENWLKLKGQRLVVKVRPNMVNSYHNVSGGLPLLFYIDGQMYWPDEERGDLFFLSPFRLQNNAMALARDLNTPDRFEVAKDKITRNFDKMTS